MDPICEAAGLRLFFHRVQHLSQLFLLPYLEHEICCARRVETVGGTACLVSQSAGQCMFRRWITTVQARRVVVSLSNTWQCGRFSLERTIMARSWPFTCLSIVQAPRQIDIAFCKTSTAVSHDTQMWPRVPSSLYRSSALSDSRRSTSTVHEDDCLW